MMDGKPLQGVSHIAPCDSCDKLQHPCEFIERLRKWIIMEY